MPPKLLQNSDELILAGWVVYRDFFRLPTTTPLLQDFAKEAFNVILLAPWISSFLHRQHLSYKRDSTVTQAELNPEKEEVNGV